MFGVNFTKRNFLSLCVCVAKRDISLCILCDFYVACGFSHLFCLLGKSRGALVKLFDLAVYHFFNGKIHISGIFLENNILLL